MTKGAFVYIDAENLDASVKACGYKAMDYPKLLNWLRSSRRVQRAYLYAGYSTPAEKTAYRALERQGYVLGLKKVMQYPGQTSQHKLRCPGCGQTNQYKITTGGRRKANCDSELTLDAINDGVRKKYNEIIVFSGDGDFCRMYGHIAETLKKRVTVYTPMSGIAGKRTAASVKILGAKRIITVNALEGILSHYAVK